MPKQIEITFKDGAVKLEGHGFKGKECDKAMADYEQALGQVSDRKNKPEYLQQSTGATLKQTT